jgi:predicted adenine nucleotide alpha hydrolase (AANH) superfamily ATPase
MRVLLHACCGPCLIEPFEALARVHDVTVAYANPNIHPVGEYRRRRDTLRGYASANGIDVVELPYEPASWIRAVAGLEDDRPRRCRDCFGMRLGIVAARGTEDGFDAVATTLTVSPYQDAEAVREAGLEACSRAGVAYLDTDFRERYGEATRRSREAGMYRQNYCGCLLSEIEAERERAERRAARQASREG